MVLDRGDLVFDVGASVGIKSAAYIKHDARVVCIEPVPDSVERLRQAYRDDERVSIVWSALGAREGSTTLHVCSGWPDISTVTRRWMEGRFRDWEWDQQIEVPMTTLDALIRLYGRPAFCKIDAEGYEKQILQGLSTPLAALSFEFAREGADEAAACMQRLAELGDTRYNLAFGENDVLHFESWTSAGDVLDAIATNSDPMAWGDVYALTEIACDGAAETGAI
jgi:FkbM family methyltransferase